MSHLLNLYEAKTQLSALVEQVANSGDEVIIAKNGVPMAKLVRFEATSIRKPGGWEGKVWESPDAWEPMTEVELAGFYGGPSLPGAKSSPPKRRSKPKRATGALKNR
jgi:antitoxin (DNA-binding transcriptional repressor) of toxin-antitoxin stability system